MKEHELSDSDLLLGILMELKESNKLLKQIGINTTKPEKEKDLRSELFHLRKSSTNSQRTILQQEKEIRKLKKIIINQLDSHNDT